MKKFWENRTIPYYRNRIEDLFSSYDTRIDSHIYLPSQDSLDIFSNTTEIIYASLHTIIPDANVKNWLLNNMPSFSKSFSTYHIEVHPTSRPFYFRLADTPEKTINFLIQKNLLIFIIVSTEYETVYESFQAEYSHDIYLKKDPALRDLKFVRIEPEEEQA